MSIDLSRLSRDQLVKLEVGQIFTAGKQKYVLQGKLGDGAIGVVRKARNTVSGKLVVVKFLAPEPRYIDVDSMDDIYRRFMREGMRGKELFHDNLVEIIAIEENKDGSNFEEKNVKDIPVNPFIVMENAGNRTLEGYIKKDKGIPRKKININKDTIYIAHEVARALEYLHKRGIVHRDVKPANIFMTRERKPQVKLGDFGIVKWNDFKASLSTGTLTTTGQKGLGTLKYMAPEQSIDPKEVGVQSDIYSFGITLFELFTNQILHDVHHVFLIREVRLERTTLDTRIRKLGLGLLPPELKGYEYLFEKILDTSLKTGNRPTSRKFVGILKTLLNDLK